MSLIIPLLVNIFLIGIIVLLGKIKTKGITKKLEFNSTHLLIGLCVLSFTALILGHAPVIREAYSKNHTDLDQQISIVIIMCLLTSIVLFLKIYLNLNKK